MPVPLAAAKHTRGLPQQEIYTSQKAIRNTKGTRDTLTIPGQYPVRVLHIPPPGLVNTLRRFADCSGQGYGETFICGCHHQPIFLVAPCAATQSRLTMAGRLSQPPGLLRRPRPSGVSRFAACAVRSGERSAPARLLHLPGLQIARPVSGRWPGVTGLVEAGLRAGPQHGEGGARARRRGGLPDAASEVKTPVKEPPVLASGSTGPFQAPWKATTWPGGSAVGVPPVRPMVVREPFVVYQPCTAPVRVKVYRWPPGRTARRCRSARCTR